ncbi:hypothetical protein EDB80DRAFT_702622 [Ilyonectria destructans]|nr:hypothetical protein EDB80DRAFT_702622 [Ilyonectria destructans]
MPRVRRRSKKHSRVSRTEDDWKDVSEPAQRRRIQNRNAQRKFRQKIKETAEKAERDSLNQSNSQNSYRTLDALEMAEESEVSGLPWGSINLRHIIAKGHEEQRTQAQQNQLLADASILCGSSDTELIPNSMA